MFKHDTSVTDQNAVDTARLAHEAGQRVIVIRFNEKLFGDANMSGYPVNSVNTGIAAIERTGYWHFVQMAGIEKDSRTLGDRIAFFAVFERRDAMQGRRSAA